MNKKIIMPALLIGTLATAGAIWLGSGNVKAAFGNNKDEMVSELAQKLNISEDKVATSLDEIRTERQEARRAEQDKKLDQAVSDGVITIDQKNQLIEKRNAFRAKESKVREEHRAEMDQWMTDNNIDHEKLQTYMGGGGKGGHGMGKMMR